MEFRALWTDAVRHVGIGVRTDIRGDVAPVTAIPTDFLAPSAHGQKPLQRANIVERPLQILNQPVACLLCFAPGEVEAVELAGCKPDKHNEDEYGETTRSASPASVS